MCEAEKIFELGVFFGDDFLPGQTDEKNSGGWYWSSSLGANSRFAAGFRFYSEYESGKTEVSIKNNSSYCGGFHPQ